VCFVPDFSTRGSGTSLPETDGATHIDPHIGAVVFIHRFGGLLNAHLHFHVLMSVWQHTDARHGDG
jgi:hypothetical protein